MATLAEKFGRVVRRLRLAAGLSQEDLAEAAKVHRNTAGLIERGQRVPSLTLIAQLADALGTSMSAMLAAVEDEPDEEG